MKSAKTTSLGIFVLVVLIVSPFCLRVEPPSEKPQAPEYDDTLDTTSPMILSTSPTHGQVVYPDVDVIIQFNESMNTSSFSWEFLSGWDPGLNWSWEGTIYENDTIRGTHAALFDSPATYEFNITYAEDVAGNPLTSGPLPNPWNWSTVVIMVSTDPAHGETNVPLDKEIVIVFSGTVRPWEVTLMFGPDSGVWTFIWLSDSFIIIGNLWPCTTYFFGVYKDGWPFPSLVPNPWTFLTACPPKIIRTSPMDFQTNVALDAPVEIEFDKPMDTGTVNWTITPDPGGWTDGWSHGETLLTLSHAGHFDPNTTYTMMVTEGLDQEGNLLVPGPIPNPWIWTIEDVPKTLEPPTRLAAFLSGPFLTDVTMTWDLAFQDYPGGNVTGYDILRGVDSFDRRGAGYTLLDTLPGGVSQYVDQLVGADDHSYFYLVCAKGAGGPGCSDDQAAKFTGPLSPGPNLVSIPLIQSDENIETVFQTMKYDRAWFYDSSSQEWKWFTKDKTYSRGLSNLNNTMGVWVNATQDCNLTVAGIVPAQTTIRLYAGWNLVGFPSFNTYYTVADLKAEAGATRVEGYAPTPPHHLRVLEDAEVLLAGYGYWVKVDIDIDWIVEVS